MITLRQIVTIASVSLLVVGLASQVEAAKEPPPPKVIEATSVETKPMAIEHKPAVVEAMATESDPTKRQEKFPLTGGVELGGSFSQVLSKLGASINPGIEVGYLLPVLEQRLAAMSGLSYVRPAHQDAGSDPRLAGGDYSYNIREEELLLTVGALYRFFPPGTQLNFYGQLGWRTRFQRSTVVGDSGGADFGKNTETATEAVGVLFGGGVEYALGPGAVAAELEFSAGDLNQRITGNTTAGGIAINVGYHFLF